jgi:3-(3-hydroxy-phenyl)propionate hydroxylase
MSDAVVVAGGGPTGLMLACELALAGVRTIVLERQQEPNARSRGMAIHGRTLEAFAARGLRERVRDEDSFIWPRTPFALMWLDLTTVDDRDHTVAYPQWRTERILAERAAELGVEIRRAHEVIGVSQEPSQVAVEVRSADGDYQLTGAYLVGCDGARSVVRRLAGIGFGDGTISHHGLFADVAPTDGLHDSFAAGLHPTGMAAAMPIEPGTLRLMAIELDTEPPADAPDPTPEELADMIGRITGSRPALAQARWTCRFGGRTRLADRYQDGRILLAGDAAHELFISGTQGLNAGIQDAMNLGWKLAATVHGWAPAGLLDTYDKERHAIGRRICMHARATEALVHDSATRVGPLRDLFAEFLRFEEANRHLLRIPTTSDLPRPEGSHPLAGTRIPDFPLMDPAGPVSLAEALRSGRGLLVEVGPGRAAEPHLDGLAGWAGRVDHGRAETVPGLAVTGPGTGVLLIRPDGHVAFADETGTDTASLRSALASWFGAPAPVPT